MADPDPQIRPSDKGAGDAVIQTLGRSQSFRQFGLKIGGVRTPPLDPPLGETLSLNLVLLIVLVLEFKGLSNADPSQCHSQQYVCHQNPLTGDIQRDSGEHGE